MANPFPAATPAPSAAIRLPAAGSWLLWLGLILALPGGFLTLVMSKPVSRTDPLDYAVFQNWLGTVLLWLGVAFFVGGLVLEGVRGMLQQHADLMRGANAVVEGESGRPAGP